MKNILTIIIPIYNIKEEYLRVCLDSIVNQSNPNWVSILIDDGSPDNCGLICDEYAEKDSRFSVIHQENMGVSVARNKGIDLAISEWITFVDPDDWVDPDLVNRITVAASENDVDVLMYGYKREFKRKSISESLCIEGVLQDDMLRDVRLAPLDRLIIHGKVKRYSVNAIWNKAYRLNYINDNKFRFEPSAKKGQDRIFNLYVLDRTSKIYYMDYCLYHYRNDNETSIVNRYNPNTVKNSIIAIGLMDRWIHDKKKGQNYRDRLNCWICSRIQSYMKLYYFNKNSKMSFRRAARILSLLICKEPFVTALKVKKSNMTKEEIIFLFFIKRNMFRTCLAMMKIKEWVDSFRK